MSLRPIVISQWGQYHCMYLPLYVALEEGFFREQGLDVEIKLSGNDDDIFNSVASGQADFGVGTTIFQPLHVYNSGSPFNVQRAGYFLKICKTGRTIGKCLDVNLHCEE